MKLRTYLNYGGNCAQAFRFYEQHLGGKITVMITHGETPAAIPPNGKCHPPRPHHHRRRRTHGKRCPASERSPSPMQPSGK